MKKFIYLLLFFFLTVLSAEELGDEINSNNYADFLNAENEKIQIANELNKIKKDLPNIKDIDLKKYESYKIDVDVNKKTMYFYGINEGGKVLLQVYLVGSPKTTVDFPHYSCKVLKVETNPWWYPSQNTIQEFKEKKNINLPRAIAPGDKNNYMGPFKIILSNSTQKNPSIYRIHGNVDATTIGKRSSGGCVRMYNDEGKEFAILVRDILKQDKQISVLYI
ncbi:MAG: L,D-transpeptidase family protein [Candidatus Gracilibacteria bacterium]|nr:L,D-transpeptidase family protein [Candidatus Gracilibacteria bacterium]